MPKIHYQHPKMPKGHNACGLGDRNKILISTNLDEVTCDRCLRTATAGKNGGRPESGMRQIMVNVMLPVEVIDWLSTKNKSETIRTLLIEEMARATQ
jgi:hypothetical protein